MVFNEYDKDNENIIIITPPSRKSRNVCLTIFLGYLLFLTGIAFIIYGTIRTGLFTVLSGIIMFIIGLYGAAVPRPDIRPLETLDIPWFT
jgi:hypothetical protein